MDSYRLHIPAWYNDAAGTNVDEREVAIFLPYVPFKGLQIDVDNGGIVEVATVRVAVQWRASEFGNNPLDVYPKTHVYTNWRQRPEGAKVFRHRDITEF